MCDIMDTNTIIGYLDANRSELIGLVQTMFDAQPPEPRIVIGRPADLGYTPKTAPIDIGKLEGDYVDGMYMEANRTVFINSGNIEKHCRTIGSTDFPLNPLEYAVRIFAKEYGQHVYSSLHGFAAMDKVTEYEEQESEETVVIAQYGASFTEAVGVAAMLKVAEALGHSDKHLAIWQAEIIGLFDLESPRYVRNARRGILLGLHWLSQLSDKEFRAVVRMSQEEAWVYTEDVIQYLLNNGTLGEYKQLHEELKRHNLS